MKGRFGYDYIYHPKRVTTPLVRRYLLEGKPKPEGREQVFAVSTDGKPISDSQISNDWDWVETDWDTALNIIADKLVEIYKRDGSDAMAVYAVPKPPTKIIIFCRKCIALIVPHQQCGSLHAPVSRGFGGCASTGDWFFCDEQHGFAGDPK